MKYRVRIDLSFNEESDARDLFKYARKAGKFSSNVTSQEPGFCDLEICRHDENKPCESLDHISILK